MNVVAYCRVSTDKEDQLNSLQTQRRFFEEFCTANKDYNLVEIYADEGITGTKIKKRYEFQRLMRDAQLGKFELLLVKDISRFARNTVDFLQSIRTLKDNHIETNFVTSNMTVLGNSELMLTFFAGMAQEESANMSKRVKFGKKENVRLGNKVPNIVFGYDKIDGANLVINEKEAEIVRRIFSMYINDGVGLGKIVMMLNDEGIRTKRGYKWAQGNLNKLVRNELYTGVIINGREEIEDFLTGKRIKKDESEWVRNERPNLRIIDQETFDKAQELLTQRAQMFRNEGCRYTNAYTLSSLIKCGECGSTFRRTIRKTKVPYAKWVCAKRNMYGVDICSNKSTVDEEEIYDVLNSYFVSLAEKKDQILNYAIDEFKKSNTATENVEASIKKLRTEKEKILAKKKKYMNMYTDDIITREELKEYNTEVQSAIERIEKQLNLYSQDITEVDALRSALKILFDEIDGIVDVRDMSNVQLKRIVDKIVINPDDTADIYLKVFDYAGIDERVVLQEIDTKIESNDSFHLGISLHMVVPKWNDILIA